MNKIQLEATLQLAQIDCENNPNQLNQNRLAQAQAAYDDFLKIQEGLAPIAEEPQKPSKPAAPKKPSALTSKKEKIEKVVSVVPDATADASAEGEDTDPDATADAQADGEANDTTGTDPEKKTE